MNTSLRRMILIDDDRSFGLIMKRCALQQGIELDFFESLADLGFVALASKYDVAILDYDLGNMTGIEIGEYFSALFDRMPMLLISGTMRTPSPEEIKMGLVRSFMHKNSGYDLILKAALDLSSTPGESISQAAVPPQTRRHKGAEEPGEVDSDPRAWR